MAMQHAPTLPHFISFVTCRLIILWWVNPQEHQIAPDLKSRLRSYFFYQYQTDAGAGLNYNEIFDLMSPSLKQQVREFETCIRGLCLHVFDGWMD